MRCRLRATVVLICLAAVGCGGPSGPPTGSVTGQITLDGKPLPDGAISFVPIDGLGATSGAKISAGSYRADVPLGDKRVEIRASRVVGEKPAYDTPDSPMMKIFEDSVPAQYNAQSDLKTTVKAGRNKADFTLQSAKK